jgi:hypothetical protein
MIIRQIQPQEIDSIIILAEYFRDEHNLDNFNSNKMLDTIREYTIQLTHSWLVAFDNQRPVGFIAGNINQLPWSEELFAIIELIYLIPSHNSEENYLSLYKEFDIWATNIGVKNIKVVAYGYEKIQIKSLYEKLGYQEKYKILDKESE